MILLGAWGRNYDSKGEMTAFPAGAWKWYAANLEQLGPGIDGLQLPPAALTASGTAANGDGYGVKEYRNLDGTYWGNQADLVALSAAARARGLKLFGDFPLRQMDGENCGPGCFTYDGRPGAMTPSCFQYFGQPGESKPPFVAQDDIPNTNGDTPYGRVRSYQNCIPAGYVEQDSKEVLAFYKATVDYYGGRMDEAKAIHVRTMARLVAGAHMDLYGEYMSGDPSELNWYATSEPMNRMMALEDYCWYWHLQQACNAFNARLLKQSGTWGFFEWQPGLAVGFSGNPDVTPSRGENNTISEQIVFNLASANALTLCLPMKMQIIDAQAYWGSSATFPECYGLKEIIDNICWFANTFAIGAWAELWLDDDLAAYSRNGDGGEFGWSGGCVVAVNFNTWDERTVTLDTMWWGGQRVHNYSATGKSEDYVVGDWGKLTITIPPNTNSSGRAYLLIAPVME